MTKTKLTFLTIGLIALADLFGAYAWFLSGQAIPQDGFFIGRGTVETLRFIFSL